MGRWSQAKRRGGGGPVPAAAVSIVSVTKTGATQVDVVFSATIVVAVGIIDDPGLTVGGNNVEFVATVTPTTVRLQIDGTVNVGNAWSLTSQPAWLLTAAAVPEAGVVL